MRTLRDALRAGSERLYAAGNEDDLFDARQLLCLASGLDRTALALRMDEPMDPAVSERYDALIERRAGGYPLQYLLGEWDFYDLTLRVGEGVLIPRPETEILVDHALEFLRTPDPADHTPEVLDLCAGTGCVGLAVAKHAPQCHVTSIEVSPEALVYLRDNVARLDASNVTVLEGDITAGFSAFSLPEPDLILSNPPYVASSEMQGLPREVHYEPALALEAGEDGLKFYRILADLWLPHLRPDGMAAVECGDDQAIEVADLFSAVLPQTAITMDHAGIGRVVRARRV